ncbi:MAG: hypothetical protein B7Z73_19770 [Planctomycetia bacterium 21-64-5]|nr:MAG: hypothetical protein B7Z73_19770 [Planctomycetia bacterium 21-64-5]
MRGTGVTPAAKPFPHTLIRASAGTGKTFQLSNRYLGLAAAGSPTDEILATTFTRKAAGEILEKRPKTKKRRANWARFSATAASTPRRPDRRWKSWSTSFTGCAFRRSMLFLLSLPAVSTWNWACRPAGGSSTSRPISGCAAKPSARCWPAAIKAKFARCCTC